MKPNRFEALKLLAEQTSVAPVSDVMDPRAHRITIRDLIAVRPEKRLFGQALADDAVTTVWGLGE